MSKWLNEHEEIQIQLLHIMIFLKWCCLSGLTGILVGLAAALFAESMNFVTNYRIAHPLIIGALPLAGLLIVFLYTKAGVEHRRGTNLVISSIRSQDSIPFTMAPLIFISTILTHLFGGSAGREGAALQIGGSLGQQIGRLCHLNEKDLKLITMCGMSAAFSALFGTPLTATVFAMEVISVGIMHYSALVPCSLASIIAAQTAMFFGLGGETFTIALVPEFSFSVLGKVILLAALCAFLSMFFCFALHKASHIYETSFSNPYIRIFISGLLIILLTLIFGTDYNGAGMNIIAAAIEDGHSAPFAFLLKLIFTAVTLGAGFKGGEIVPSLFIGACFGCVIAPLIGLSSSFGAAIGMMVLFCGVTNCPMTSLFLVFELFGFHSLVLFLIADAVGYMLSGYYGLYNEQKIMYSKYEVSFINNNANEKAD